MLLCELIAQLEAADPQRVVPLGFKHPHSYRGYYEELAFEPVSRTLVADMLQAAKSALGAIYEGYRGGEFKMDASTKCYLAHWGECGEPIGPVLLDYMLGKYDSDSM